MQRWTDSRGIHWDLEITWGFIRRVKDLSGVTMSELFEKVQESPTMEDIADFSGVMLELLRTQEPGMSDQKFTELTRGSFVKLIEAFVAEVTDFFDSQGFKEISPSPMEKTMSEIQTSDSIDSSESSMRRRASLESIRTVASSGT